MSEKWPSAEDVEADISSQLEIGTDAWWKRALRHQVYLEQFAALLRQMEAHGSPRTEAAAFTQNNEFTGFKDQEVVDADLCRHFESALGAVEARTVERCAKVADKYCKNVTGLPKGETPVAVLVTMATAETIGEEIRALLRASDRRIRGERRFRSMDPVDGRYAKDRRIAKQPRRQS